MKKALFFAIGLVSMTAFGQQGRVGINTNEPNASLEIRRHNNLPVSSPQGLILPKYSTTDRDKFILDTDKQRGLMIYNLTKNCIDWWDGTKWQCMNSVQENSQTTYTSEKSASLSGTFTRSNCPSGYTGSQVTYTTPTYTETRTSTVSQTDADNLAQVAANTKAQEDLNANGQNYANANGVCSPSAPDGATTTVGTEFKCDVWGKNYRIQTNLGYFSCKTQILTEDYADVGYWFWEDRGNANAKDYGLTEICYSDPYNAHLPCAKGSPETSWGDESHILIIGKVGTDGSVINWVRRVN